MKNDPSYAKASLLCQGSEGRGGGQRNDPSYAKASEGKGMNPPTARLRRAKE